LLEEVAELKPSRETKLATTKFKVRGCYTVENDIVFSSKLLSSRCWVWHKVQESCSVQSASKFC